jgi:hypothetical protein
MDNRHGLISDVSLTPSVGVTESEIPAGASRMSCLISASWKATSAGGGPYHGADGPMKVSDCEFQFPISNVFVDAARQTGMPITDECPSVGGRWSLSTHDRKRSPVRRGLDPVELAQLPLDVPRAHPAGVHRDDLVVEPGKASLVLGDQLRLKGAAPIPRNLQVHLAGIGDDGLLAVAVAVAVAPLTSTPRVKSWALPFCVLPVPMVPRTGFFGRVAS